VIFLASMAGVTCLHETLGENVRNWGFAEITVLHFVLGGGGVAVNWGVFEKMQDKSDTEQNVQWQIGKFK
jgi:hypothetical protein